MNRKVRRYKIRERIHKVVANATTEYVEAGEVGRNRILYVTAGSIEDQTTAPDQIAFGVKHGDEFIVMEEEDSPAAGISYHLEKTHHFLPGERPAFRVEGAALSDILEGYIEGYVEME